MFHNYTIVIPSSGSYEVRILDETEDEYICEHYSGGWKTYVPKRYTTLVSGTIGEDMSVYLYDWRYTREIRCPEWDANELLRTSKQ